jgi:hypothetical protein
MAIEPFLNGLEGAGFQSESNAVRRQGHTVKNLYDNQSG